MDFGDLAEAIRPWITSGAIVGLFGVVANLWLKNKRLSIDSDGGIRDHYAKEVAGLRDQVLAVQQAATQTAAAAEDRYNKAIRAADERHLHCEAECERLRNRVSAVERKYYQLHQSTLRLFEPRSDLSKEVRDHMRALEQSAMIVINVEDMPDEG